MRESEELWRRGEYAAATERYDVALAEAIAAGDAEREGSLAMAKGVALLQRIRAGSSGAEVLRSEARRCLDRARTLGSPAQVEFVNMVARKEGLVPLPPAAAVPGEPCAHRSHSGGESASGGPCSSTAHDAAVDGWAREAAQTAAALEEGADDAALRAVARDRAVSDAVLVRAVARVGVGDWDAVADEFARDMSGGATEAPPADCARTAAALATRWATLRPAVRDAMKRSAESGEELACGHACATCPTRRECHLHDIVDIEDAG